MNGFADLVRGRRDHELALMVDDHLGRPLRNAAHAFTWRLMGDDLERIDEQRNSITLGAGS